MARTISILLLVLMGPLRVAVVRLGCALTHKNPAIVPVPRVTPWWTVRHISKLERVKAGGVDLLFVGDSITQNYEQNGPSPNEMFLPAWEEFFAAHHALNLGYGGDQTQNVLWRLQHGEVAGLAPKDVVLLIGTNNTWPRPNSARVQSAAEVTTGVVAVVEELHTRLPGAKILLIEILPSAVSTEKSAKDAVVNAALRLRYAQSAYVRCLDLSSLFMKDGKLDKTLYFDSQLKAPFGSLHPDTVGQRRMAEAVAKALYTGP